MFKRLLIVWLLLLSSVVVSAQTEDDSGVGDSIFPTEGNSGYDVQHYNLDIVWDGEESIVASAEIQLIPTENLTDFHLDFHGLNIDNITVNGVVATFDREGDELIITPVNELQSDELTTVMIRYHGEPNAIEGNLDAIGDVIGGWHTTTYGVYVASEPNGAKSWYPTNNHPTDPATYTFRVTVPEPNIVIANGLLVDETDNGETTTFVWQANDPIASYLTTVVIGEYRKEEQVGPNDLPIYNYYHVDVPETATQDFGEQPAILARFAEVFGDYPFESAGAIVIPESSFPALETQTRAIYGQEATAYPIIAHELAHQWFGNAITLEDWRDIWVKEGFATYAEYLYEEVRDGGDPEAVLSYFASAVQWDSTAPSDVSASNLYHTGVYMRAGLMLHHLRLRLGDETFFNLTRTYVQQFQGDAASGDDFITLAESVSGEDLGEFFDAWLNDDELPEMEVEPNVDFGTSSGDENTITITSDTIESLLPSEDSNNDGRIQINEINTSELGIDLTNFDISTYGLNPDDVDIEELFFVLIDEQLIPFESLLGDASAPSQSTANEWSNDSTSHSAFNEPPIEPFAVDWAGMDEREQRLFTQISKMFQTFRDNATMIWNNGSYRFDEMPMMFVYRDADGKHPYAYLINHPDPEALDATLVNLDPSLTLPTIYRIENHNVLNDIDSRMPFDFARDVAGTSTFVMVYLDAEVDSFQSADYWDFSLFTVHEAFHQYQLFDARWKDDPDSTQNTTNYPLTQENVSLVLLEDRILAAALMSDDVDFKRDALRQFLAVRQTRIEQNDLIQRIENNQEVAEGTARYIEYRFESLAGISSGLLSSPVDGIYRTESLFEGNEELTDESLREELGFGRAYASGAALGILLDNVGVDWHSRVESGETLIDILRDTFELSENDIKDLLTQAKSTYDFDAITVMVEEKLP